MASILVTKNLKYSCLNERYEPTVIIIDFEESNILIKNEIDFVPFIFRSLDSVAKKGTL